MNILFFQNNFSNVGCWESVCPYFRSLVISWWKYLSFICIGADWVVKAKDWIWESPHLQATLRAGKCCLHRSAEWRQPNTSFTRCAKSLYWSWPTNIFRCIESRTINSGPSCVLLHKQQAQVVSEQNLLVRNQLLGCFSWIILFPYRIFHVFPPTVADFLGFVDWIDDSNLLDDFHGLFEENKEPRLIAGQYLEIIFMEEFRSWDWWMVYCGEELWSLPPTFNTGHHSVIFWNLLVGLDEGHRRAPPAAMWSQWMSTVDHWPCLWLAPIISKRWNRGEKCARRCLRFAWKRSIRVCVIRSVVFRACVEARDGVRACPRALESASGLYRAAHQRRRHGGRGLNSCFKIKFFRSPCSVSTEQPIDRRPLAQHRQWDVL